MAVRTFEEKKDDDNVVKIQEETKIMHHLTCSASPEVMYRY